MSAFHLPELPDQTGLSVNQIRHFEGIIISINVPKGCETGPTVYRPYPRRLKV